MRKNNSHPLADAELEARASQAIGRKLTYTDRESGTTKELRVAFINSLGDSLFAIVDVLTARKFDLIVGYQTYRLSSEERIKYVIISNCWIPASAIAAKINGDGSYSTAHGYLPYREVDPILEMQSVITDLLEDLYDL